MRLFEGTQWDRPPTCERCGKLEEACECPPESTKPTWIAPDRQQAKIRVEKRKRGKVVTVVAGLIPTESDLNALLTQLKDSCGAGGTLKDDLIEIQGDHASRVQGHLEGMGYRVKRAR